MTRCNKVDWRENYDHASTELDEELGSWSLDSWSLEEVHKCVQRS